MTAHFHFYVFCSLKTQRGLDQVRMKLDLMGRDAGNPQGHFLLLGSLPWDGEEAGLSHTWVESYPAESDDKGQGGLQHRYQSSETESPPKKEGIPRLSNRAYGLEESHPGVLPSPGFWSCPQGAQGHRFAPGTNALGNEKVLFPSGNIPRQETTLVCMGKPPQSTYSGARTVRLLPLQEIITATGKWRVFGLGQTGENPPLGGSREVWRGQASPPPCPSPGEAPTGTGRPQGRGPAGRSQSGWPPWKGEGLHPAQCRLKYMWPQFYLQFICGPDIRDT